MSVLISLGHFLHACFRCMFLSELQCHRAYKMFIIVRCVYDRENMTIIVIYQDCHCHCFIFCHSLSILIIEISLE